MSRIGIGVVIAAVGGYFSFRSTQHVTFNNTIVDHQKVVLVELEKLQTTLKNSETEIAISDGELARVHGIIETETNAVRDLPAQGDGAEELRAAALEAFAAYARLVDVHIPELKRIVADSTLTDEDKMAKIAAVGESITAESGIEDRLIAAQQRYAEKNNLELKP